MKRGSTLFLQVVIVLIGLAVLALCIFVLPVGIRTDQTGAYRPILIGMYLPAVPFFIGLFQSLKLISLINRNKAFSKSSVKPLRIIKYCAITISTLYAVGLPYIFMVAQADDAPGVVLIGLIFTFAPMIIAVFAAILQKMFQDAINIKSENDLTV